MAYEVVDNSIDEALAGYCKTILVEINKDGTIAVSEKMDTGIILNLIPLKELIEKAL